MNHSTKELSEQFKNDLLIRKNSLQQTEECLIDKEFFVNHIKNIMKEIDRIDATIEEIDRIENIYKIIN
jgi:hypothetical protein